MLNLDILRSFVEVAQSGSFSKAALNLGLSQPTVSEHIRLLEARLGEGLIIRGRRKSDLTPAGEKVLTTARRIMALSAGLFTINRASSIQLGVSSNILVYYLAAQVAGLNPSEVTMQIKSNPELAKALIEGVIDAAIVEWPIEHTNVMSRKLFEDSLVVILSPEHPLSTNASITVKQLKTLKLFGGESGTGTFSLLKKAFGQEVDDLQIGGNLGSTEAVKRAVMGNAGASIVLEGSVKQELADGRLVGLPVKGHQLSKNFYVCARDEILQSAQMSSILQGVEKSFAIGSNIKRDVTVV